MPPSPALRYSPGRELRTSNHKRGRSFEGGLLLKEKDDDLSLFTEMQARERENFLLHSSDEFQDSFSTHLKHFSDFKLGISIPVRGQSSELLNADGDKNDYDWLLTPPDTPLFPSLDDEPLKLTAASRGRPRTQPISISRSSTMEKSHRSRGSASPSRVSPSPRSGSSMPQSRGRPVSTPHSSPTPSLRPSTPSRRSSPSPNKASTFVPRSSSPTPRRLSTGSSSTDSTSGMRGTSPIKTTRGKSASPKMMPWKTNIPGFSSNAPPNLRTSLADRPSSYVRRSSPASRSSNDSASKVNRQSMSPTTTSRSVSSCHSHDRDRNSSYSRASVASSGDDDADSLHSISMSTSDYPSSKNVSAFSNNKVLAFSKKSGRTLSSTYAPKRSVESTIRQLDHRKTPQNMFRPLLSSVPSTTFYTGNMSSVHHSLISRNSSVTTSSNASSDLCASFVPDTEGRDHNQEYMVSDREKILYPDTHEEVFSFDKMDAVNEDYLNEIGNLSLNDTQGDGSDSSGAKHGFSNFEISNKYGNNLGETSLVSKASHMEGESSEAILEEMELCSRCRRNYSTTELLEKNIKLCFECSEEERLLGMNVNIPEKITPTTESTPVSSLKISETNLSMDQMESAVLLPESPQHTDVCDLRVSQSYETVEGDQNFCSEQKQNRLEENSPLKSVAEDGHGDSNLLESGQSFVVPSLPDTESECPQLLPRSDSKFEMSEGTGISLLLKRSSSNKGHVVQGRNYTANIFANADLSYARDSVSSLKSSIGHSSFSGSSSADFSSSRQTDHMQSQSSGRKLEMENNKYEINTKSRSIGIAFSEIPTDARETSHLVMKTQEAISNFPASLGLEETSITSEKPILASEYAESDTTCTSSTTVVEEGDFDDSNCGETVCTYTSELVSNQFEDDLAKSCPNYEDCSSYDNKDFSSNKSISDVEVSIISPESSLEKDPGRVDGDGFFEDGVDVPSHSLSMISETEMARNSDKIHGSQSGENSLISKDILKENQESSVHTYSDNGDMLVTSLEPVASDSILEESTVMVECQSGSTTRSLTLEEVTDTILFCSSIVHDLAYSAATIGMEKQSEVELEGSRPMVTILGKSNSDRKEPRLRNVNKRAPKSQKPRQRRKEIDPKPLTSKTENDENTEDYVVRNVGVPDSMKPPKLESKCNCSIM